MSETDNGKRVVDLVSRLVARGEHERAEMMQEVARRQEAGEDPAQDEEGRFDWRRFAVHFAEQYPGAAAFAPVSALIYLYLIYQLIFGS